MSLGTDVWALGTLRTGRLATGVTLVAQAWYRRLSTPRGELKGGPDADVYGFDLAAYVGEVGTTVAMASLPSQIAAELRKDDRALVLGVFVAIDKQPSGTDKLNIEIDGQTDEGEAFSLTLAVDAVSVSVLGVPS